MTVQTAAGNPRAPTAWWVGRTFYACPCGFQHETHVDKVPEPPETLPCTECKTGTLRQWQPRRG